MITEIDIENLLRPLIETDTSNPPGENYRKICEIIRQQLESVGCDVNLYEVPSERVAELVKEAEGVSGERINLVASLKRGEGKRLILNGHFDVVPASGSWLHPPFKLTRDGEYWYGRGVADMKGSLAAMIKVMHDLSSNDKWRGSIILEAVCDEEIGGYTGTAFLHDSGIVKGDYCIVGDGSITHVTNAANGCLRFRITLKGKSVHSSMNWKGINAVEKAAMLIAELKEYNKLLHKRKSKVATNPESGVMYVTASITVGTIRGGTKVNIVPDECVLSIDRRVIPEEDKNDATSEFMRILDDLKTKDKDFSYDLIVGGFHDSFRIPEDAEPIPTLRQTYRQVTGRACPLFGGLGCYDAAHIAKHDLPVAILGTSRVESSVHGLDERVRVKDVIDFANVTEETILKLLRT